MDFGSICLCMTLGALICFVFLGVGVCIGRCDKEQSDDDSSVCGSSNIRCGDRCGDKRDIPPTYEEKIMVLDTFSVGSSALEKRVLGSLRDDLKKLYEVDE